jgi:DNA-binding NarL/FixJ family response regulator
MKSITVMFVGDDEYWHQNLIKLLGQEPDIQVIHACFDEQTTLEALQHQCPDIILLDIMLSEQQCDVIKLAGRLRHLVPSKVIMISSRAADRKRILQGFDQGAVNFIGKDSFHDIPHAIRAAYAGRISIHPDSSDIVLQELRREKKLRILTPTERVVYDLREEGKTRKQIAEHIFTSVENVKKHLHNIRKKLEEGGE